MKATLQLFVLLFLSYVASSQQRPPEADFVQSGTQSCTQPFTVTFKDTSRSPINATITAWKWEFGDGTIDSSGPNVIHTYRQKGIFTVKLTVRDQFGSTASINGNRYTGPTRIGASLQLPPAYAYCNNTPFSFTLKNELAPSAFDSLGTYRWSKNGTQVSIAKDLQISTEGTYAVAYTACGTTLYDTTIVAPLTLPGQISTWAYNWSNNRFKVVNWYDADFRNNIFNKLMWYWGDGQKSNGIDGLTHYYTKPGQYRLSCRPYYTYNGDTLFCDEVMEEPLDIRESRVKHNNWNGKDTLLLGAGLPLVLSAGNNGAIFNWRSEDPTFTSSQQSLTITQPGKYWVDISDNGMLIPHDTITDSILVKPLTTAYADFTYTFISCSEENIRFQSVVAFPAGNQDILTGIKWRIDGKAVSSASAFNYRFVTPGIHTVDMTINTQSGSVNTITKQIAVPPVKSWSVVLKDDTLSVPGVHVLKATATPAGTPVFFQGYGEPTNELQTTRYGTYVAYIKDSCGQERDRDTIEVLPPGSSQWKFRTNVSYNDCYTDAWLKTYTNAPAGTYTVTWNTGAVSDSIHITTSGYYIATFKDNTGKTRSWSESVMLAEPFTATIKLVTTNGIDRLAPGPLFYDNFTYYWYKDGTQLSAGPPAQVDIPRPGIYRLEMKSENGCFSSSAPFEYRMPKDSIIVNFNFAREHCNSPKVNFQAGIYTASSSTDTVTTITWNYGDGLSETLTPGRNTQHKYAAAGTYTVSMTANTRAGRQINAVKTVVIDPIIDYSIKITDDATSIPGVHILKATTTPTDKLVYWSTGARQNAIDVVKAGYYKASIRDTCSSSVLYSDSIEVKPSTITWSLNAKIGKVSYCQDSATLIADVKGPANAYSVAWSNGANKDSIVVRKSGTYTAYLLDKQGNIREMDTVTVNLTKPFEASITLRSSPSGDTLIAFPHNADLSGYKYNWYRNNTLLPTVTSPLNIKPVPGSYVVEIQNENGCKSSSAPFLYEGPLLDISFTYATDPCQKQILQFYGTRLPEDSMVTYTWDFGDGSTAAIVNPRHEFKRGTYTVSLTTRTKSGAKGFTSQQINIELFDYTPIITVQKTPCGDGAWLKATCAVKSAYFEWDHHYGVDDSIFVSEPGKYAVMTIDSCRDRHETASIIVDLKPYFAPSWDYRKNGAQDTIVLTNPGGGGGYVFDIDNPSPDITFTWKRDNEVVRVDHDIYMADPLPGDYTVDIAVVDGCTVKSEGVLMVLKKDTLPGPISFTYEVLESTCLPQVTFHGPASVPGDSITGYAWDFGDRNAGDSQDPVHVYRPGTYNVILRITTASGKTGTTRQQLTIGPSGEWSVKIIKGIDPCGDKAPLSVEAPAAAAYFEWNNGAKTREILATSNMKYIVRVFDSCHNFRASDTVSVQQLGRPFLPEFAYGLKEDTLCIHPMVRESAIYPISDSLPGYTFAWTFNGDEIPVKGSYITPIVPGSYKVKITQPAGCVGFTSILTVPTYEAWPDTVMFSQYQPVFDVSQNLSVGARFHWYRNMDNIYTLQLTLRNPGGRKNGLTPGEIITLTTVESSMQSLLLTAPLPDSLACSSDYAVRVIASSPADTTVWSVPVKIRNQPRKPVIVQRGDSLFTYSPFQIQWYKNDVAIPGAIEDRYRARTNATYTVESYNGDDCSRKSDPLAVVITALSEVTLGSNKVKAFPNPSEGEVYLKFEKPLTKSVAVNVYNLQGRLVYGTTTVQQLHTLDLSTLAKGYYLIELTGYGSRKVLPVILK